MLRPSPKWEWPPSGPYSARVLWTSSRQSGASGLRSKCHLPNWTLTIRFLGSVVCFPLASVEHRIHFRRIRFVIEYSSVDFDPGMRSERHLLRADDHLSMHSILFEQTDGGSRAL